MKNVGQTDKWIRIIIGIVLLSMFFLVEGNARYFGILGIIPLYTGLSGNCMLYKLFGINTRKDK
ncbi:MAG: YgaP family membrane protein [Halanaerobium sp.]